MLYAEELGGSIESDHREGQLLVHTVHLNLKEIDAMIAARLKPGFAVGRLERPDRVLLRLGIAELIFEHKASGVISAYTDLAGAFGGDKSPGFVNGVLAAIARETKSAEPAD